MHVDLFLSFGCDFCGTILQEGIMSKDTDNSNIDYGSKRTSLVSNKLVEEASKRKKTMDSSSTDDPFLLVSSVFFKFDFVIH